jgi:O-antigen ligase
MPHYADPTALRATLAHNTYIGIGAELGLPALLVFILMLAMSYRSLEQVRVATLKAGPALLHQTAISLQAGLLGCAVGIAFLTGEYHKFVWHLLFVSMLLPGLLKSSPRPRRAAGQAARWIKKNSRKQAQTVTAQALSRL